MPQDIFIYFFNIVFYFFWWNVSLTRNRILSSNKKDAWEFCGTEFCQSTCHSIRIWISIPIPIRIPSKCVQTMVFSSSRAPVTFVPSFWLFFIIFCKLESWNLRSTACQWLCWRATSRVVKSNYLWICHRPPKAKASQTYSHTAIRPFNRSVKSVAKTVQSSPVPSTDRGRIKVSWTAVEERQPQHSHHLSRDRPKRLPKNVAHTQCGSHPYCYGPGSSGCQAGHVGWVIPTIYTKILIKKI